MAEAARAAAAEPGTRARARGTLLDAAAALDAAALEAGMRGEPVADDGPEQVKGKAAHAAPPAAAAPATPPGPTRALAAAPAQQQHRKRPAPPAAAAPPPPPAATDTAGPKRVKWSLRSNVAHAVGAPVPPPAVRTPPGTRPRGPALAPKARTTRLGRDGTPAHGGVAHRNNKRSTLKAALFR